jgi:hypothetical protein
MGVGGGRGIQRASEQSGDDDATHTAYSRSPTAWRASSRLL